MLNEDDKNDEGRSIMITAACGKSDYIGHLLRRHFILYDVMKENQERIQEEDFCS